MSKFKRDLAALDRAIAGGGRSTRSQGRDTKAEGRAHFLSDVRAGGYPTYHGRATPAAAMTGMGWGWPDGQPYTEAQEEAILAEYRRLADERDRAYTLEHRRRP